MRQKRTYSNKLNPSPGAQYESMIKDHIEKKEAMKQENAGSIDKLEKKTTQNKIKASKMRTSIFTKQPELSPHKEHDNEESPVKSVHDDKKVVNIVKADAFVPAEQTIDKVVFNENKNRNRKFVKKPRSIMKATVGSTKHTTAKSSMMGSIMQVQDHTSTIKFSTSGKVDKNNSITVQPKYSSIASYKDSTIDGAPGFSGKGVFGNNKLKSRCKGILISISCVYSNEAEDSKP